MQLHRDRSDNINIIRGMDDTGIRVGDQLVELPCIVTVTEIIAPWPSGTVDELDYADFTPALETPPELVLLGTGNTTIIPPAALIAAINEAGMGFEFMDSAAACRTYNVLAHEGRAVVLALLGDRSDQSKTES